MREQQAPVIRAWNRCCKSESVRPASGYPVLQWGSKQDPLNCVLVTQAPANTYEEACTHMLGTALVSHMSQRGCWPVGRVTSCVQ